MDGSGSNDPDAGDAVAAYSWEIYDKAGNLVTTGSESSLTADNTVLPPGTTYDVSADRDAFVQTHQLDAVVVQPAAWLPARVACSILSPNMCTLLGMYKVVGQHLCTAQH